MQPSRLCVRVCWVCRPLCLAFLMQIHAPQHSPLLTRAVVTVSSSRHRDIVLGSQAGLISWPAHTRELACADRKREAHALPLLTCVFVPTSCLASFRFFNPTEVARSAHRSTRCVHEVPPIQHVLAPLSRSATPVQSPSHESLATHLGRRSLRCACMHACRAKWWNC
jgi:hypothetical protein